MAAEVFDLDAARAQRREASGGPSTFSFGGTEFTVPPSSEWPLDVRSALSDGNLSLAMSLLLDDQWPAFSANHPTIGDIGDLMDWLASQNGLGDSGNSSASPRTSNGTRKRSRRTSSGTTASTSSTTTGAG